MRLLVEAPLGEVTEIVAPEVGVGGVGGITPAGMSVLIEVPAELVPALFVAVTENT